MSDRCVLRVSTDKQQGRRSYQEDFVGVADISPGRTLLTLCDGHGGERASKFVVREMTRVRKWPRGGTPVEVQKLLTDVIARWNRRCFKHLRVRAMPSDPRRREEIFSSEVSRTVDRLNLDAGCTCLVALVDLKARRVDLWNIGDSQAVWFAGGTPRGMTVAHEPNAYDLGPAGGRIMRDGDTKRINGDLAVGRAIGDHSETLFGSVTARWDHYVVPVGRGFGLVLASDGVWDVLADTDCVSKARRLRTASEITHLALSSGSFDNVSAIVAVTETGTPAPSSSTAPQNAQC